ncbi:hypothetical protein A2X44_03840 [candidate division CPR3 bacterium GWF2_35_18]|uniref:AAA+ ATPase domain-containing protein n=1 Tax=candidate division CPR3 bacterium GW2011_GWF2_35_18 TaxID=1618350 RepID=A0A0G0E343_UNCC3|nr:MAG: hypothetical protein UR67_C0004G0057 [candidate division CPR3 bacterium GW2011_GWF2_35_18]OGB63142.1 MAG: hypothetical protein A2X44_03840 [candidate division CPR3 bacterium GWF2_35_18]OGB64044.1 MAG: hypothetical protein A2250_04550 [candidate division CPR3 bacterium RIFOXYA2_FULL_35_13]OGB78241.1 MAG: hypothetical protein A2296_01710 [candidate division CPR3 bacterium RIFOXYB2_FULL_35_8]
MKDLFKNISFLTKNRFIIFGIFFVVFVIVQYFSFGTFLPSTETKDLWFYSGIFMIMFSILFVEPYYTSPKNVITNVIPLLLVFLAIKTSFENIVFWWTTIVILILLLAASIIALSLDDKDKSPDYWGNKVATKLKDVVVIIGQGRVLYSSVFIYFLLTYHSIQNLYTLILFILWFCILSINPKNIHGSFAISIKKDVGDQIGEIFGVQSKKIFLVKLLKDRKSIKKFDVVKFMYSMQDTIDFIITGIVFDTYLLNQGKWAKILQLGEIEKKGGKLEKNMVYKIIDSEEVDTTNKELNVDSLVGIVIENSTIGKIKFEYSKKSDDLQEGDLLELKVGDKRLFYQVIAGSTEKEKLEAQNETGFIEGEAIQLGEWQNDKLSFQKFGWVPSINTPVFKANTSDIKVKSFKYPEYKLGIIPNTTLPSVINLDHAVSHHMALLGVTGSGKSFLAREIIKELTKDTKIICVDFTGEWKTELENIKVIVTVLNKDNIDNFLNGSDKIGIVELPVMSNTVEVINATEKLFEAIFNFSKKKYDEKTPTKISLVLEEAHTIVPEASFLGVNNFDSKAIVNKMGQIALQGRKYGIGLLVIAQRTANVSKTILTQCNTVICFQAFDETSFNFLGNYVGKDLVLTLPNLKQYNAIVAGKAVKSNVPMIIDLTRKV